MTRMFDKKADRGIEFTGSGSAENCLKKVTIKFSGEIIFQFDDGSIQEFSANEMKVQTAYNRVMLVCERSFAMQRLTKEQVLQTLGVK